MAERRASAAVFTEPLTGTMKMAKASTAYPAYDRGHPLLPDPFALSKNFYFNYRKTPTK